MRAIFHRYDGHGTFEATVLAIHDDGVATLEVAIPGQAPARVFARVFAARGTGQPGTWEALDPPAPAVAIPPDPTPLRARQPRAPRATKPKAVAPVADASPLAGPDTCPMCLRKGRWPGFYCGDDCETRAATPAGLDPWSKKRQSYCA